MSINLNQTFKLRSGDYARLTICEDMDLLRVDGTRQPEKLGRYLYGVIELHGEERMLFFNDDGNTYVFYNGEHWIHFCVRIPASETQMEYENEDY